MTKSSGHNSSVNNKRCKDPIGIRTAILFPICILFDHPSLPSPNSNNAHHHQSLPDLYSTLKSSSRGIYQYVGTDVKKVANEDEMSKISVVYEWMPAQVTSSPMPPSLLEYALASCLAIGASTTGAYTSIDD